MTAAATSPTRFLRIQVRRISTFSNLVKQNPRQLHAQSRLPPPKYTHHQRPCTRHFGTVNTPKIPLTFPNMVSEDDFILTLSCPEYVSKAQLLLEVFEKK